MSINPVRNLNSIRKNTFKYRNQARRHGPKELKIYRKYVSLSINNWLYTRLVGVLFSTNIVEYRNYKLTKSFGTTNFIDVSSIAWLFQYSSWLCIAWYKIYSSFKSTYNIRRKYVEYKFLTTNKYKYKKHIFSAIGRYKKFPVISTAVISYHNMFPHMFWHLIFKNIFFNTFINSLVHGGKKEKVELLLFNLLCSLKRKTRKQPIFLFNSVFQVLQPVVETFTINRSGKPYPVPKLVKNKRRLSFLVRIMKNIVDRQKKKICFNLRFVSELIMASVKGGLVYSKVMEMHRFSFSNRINLRFVRKSRRKRHVFI